MKDSKKRPARKRIASRFAENLQQLTKERNLTQRRISEICGVSVAVVNEWLHGSIPHDPGAVLRLSQELQVDFKWLLTGEKTELKDLQLADLFDMESDPSFSGLFMVEAKRLKRKA